MPNRLQRSAAKASAAWAIGCVLVLLESQSGLYGSSNTNGLAKSDHPFQYTNDVVEDMPWSIHVVKVRRSHPDIEFCTTLGNGDVLGMSTVSEQVKTVPAKLGEPLAAINGDFYEKSEKSSGRPRDVQIRQGEVVTNPSGHTSFWLDPDGTPHMTNVFSRFRVIWSDGKETPVSLNEARADESAVLYTAVAGKSTRTEAGKELLLEPETSTNSWLPLRIGFVYVARVREVRNSGDTPLDHDTIVLSIGPKLAARLPAIQQGATLKLATETVPNLSGANVAIGGGPSLVHNGKPMQWTGFIKMRHPRTALGWNRDYIYLVEVDGRQSNISVGMTFPELAGYLVKIGCQEAMNLDGGGSATLWALGAVRNSPSEGDERPAPNALVVVKKRPPSNGNNP